jgi:hypothetical protein
MSFLAKFNVDDEEYTILSCSYHFYQETDITGKPSSIARGGQVTVTVETTGSNKLFEWMTDSWKLLSGNLQFFKSEDEKAIMKQVDFKDAYLVSYDETFTNQKNEPMKTTVTLSAKEINVGSAEHKNEWKK